MIDANSAPEIRKAAILISSLDEGSAQLFVEPVETRQRAQAFLSQIDELEFISNREKENHPGRIPDNSETCFPAKPNGSSLKDTPMFNNQLAILIILALTCASNCFVFANDRSATLKTADDQQEAFQLPERESTKQEQQKTPSFDLKSLLGDTGIKASIVVGILLIVLLLLSKQKASRTIPGEALEILGNRPVGSQTKHPTHPVWSETCPDRILGERF